MPKPPLFPNPERVNMRLTLLKTDNQLQIESDFTMWTKVVARKKKCSKCNAKLPPGSNSIRYTVRKTKNGHSYLMEKCLCKSCALPMMEKMVEDLKKPEVIKPTKEEIAKEEW